MNLLITCVELQIIKWWPHCKHCKLNMVNEVVSFHRFSLCVHITLLHCDDTHSTTMSINVKKASFGLRGFEVSANSYSKEIVILFLWEVRNGVYLPRLSIDAGLDDGIHINNTYSSRTIVSICRSMMMLWRLLIILLLIHFAGCINSRGQKSHWIQRPEQVQFWE